MIIAFSLFISHNKMIVSVTCSRLALAIEVFFSRIELILSNEHCHQINSQDF